MRFFRREKLTPEQRITQDQINELRKLQKQKSMSSLLGAFGRAFPKGIRHPDSLVRNLHLYRPTGGKHRTNLK